MRFKIAFRACLVAVGFVATGWVTSTVASNEVKFSFKYLNDDAVIAEGKELWAQCRHCHGAAAYPGKAPKLKPHKYTPEFVYDRITNGFRKMPPWKEVYSVEQRKALTAYIKHRSFSP